jgi:Mg-chelatase subunit ChlD
LDLTNENAVVSAQARVEQELTQVFETFRKRLDHVTASGDTALYDSLDTARSMLCKYWQDTPNLRKRIIVVSDGLDTCSKNSAHEVCLAMQKSGIIVDSVQVGKESDRTLHAISVATGENLVVYVFTRLTLDQVDIALLLRHH